MKATCQKNNPILVFRSSLLACPGGEVKGKIICYVVVLHIFHRLGGNSDGVPGIEAQSGVGNYDQLVFSDVFSNGNSIPLVIFQDDAIVGRALLNFFTEGYSYVLINRHSGGIVNRITAG